MANISRKKLNDFLEETKRDLSSQRVQDNTQKTVRQNDLDAFFSDFQKALDETYTPEVLEEIKAEREARTASLRPGETRRGSKKTEDGETIPGVRWEEQNRQINATVRSADEIRKELAAVDEELNTAKHGSLRSDFGILTGNFTNTTSNEERISQLNERRERLRQELAANRNSLKNNADYAEKNQADAGFAAMTDDDMYRLVNYPEQKNDLVSSPAQGDIKVNETLKNLIDPIFSSVYNDSQYIKSMTDEERQTYNYIYKTEGRESADEYLDLIKEGLTKRSTEETGAKMEQFAEEHPVLSSAYTVATLPAKGASALGGSLGTYLSGQNLDRNASYNALANASSDIRGTVSKQIEEKWGKVGSFAYDVGMSMADFLAMGVIGKGSQIPLAILGSNAAADMTISALDRGLSDDKAMALGMVAGIAEAAAEKVGIDKLFKNPNWNKNSLLYILQNVFSELLEEGGTSLVNSLADILISREQSEWRQSINAYKEQGFSDKDAFWNTFRDTATMIGLDALGGAISGGLMGAGGVAVGKIGQGAVNRENVRETQDTWREVRKENERSQAAKTAAAIEANGFEEAETEEPLVISRPSATTEGEEFEIGREVLRDQLMTLEQQEKADAVDNAEDDLTATALKYDATERQISEARELSELTGYSVEFFRQKNPNGTVKHGFYDPNSGKIYLNVNSKRAIATTVAHEITHSLEDSASYDSLHNLVFGIKQAQGTDIDAERARERDLREKAGTPLNGNREIDAEIVADYVGTKLLDDVRAIREVYRENPSVGRKIASAIDKMIIKATGMQDMTIMSYLKRASAMYQRAEEIAENAGEAERIREEKEKAQRMTETARSTGRSFATEEMEDRARDLRRRTYVKANALEVDRKEAAQRRTEEQKKEAERKQTIHDERIQRASDAHTAADRLLEKMLKDYQSGRITEREFEVLYKKYEKSQRKSERYVENEIRRALSGEISDEQFDERLEWGSLMRDPAYNRKEKNLKDSAEAEEAARNGSDAEFLRYITEHSEDLPRWKLEALIEEYADRQESSADRTDSRVSVPEERPIVDAYKERQAARQRGETDWIDTRTLAGRNVAETTSESPVNNRGGFTPAENYVIADAVHGYDEGKYTAKQAAERLNLKAEEMIDDAWSGYDDGRYTEYEREEILNLADELRFTGGDFSRSATTVDTAEGKIPKAIREKLGNRKKDGAKFSISEEEVEERVRTGRPIEAADEVRWSISKDEDYMDAADRVNEQKKFVPYNVLADARDAREQIRKIFTDPSLADSLNLPPENIGNTYIPNGFYDGTEENTTVCIRSMAADALMDAVAEHLGRPLTVEDTITVSQEYWQYTDQPECLYCYVAMDRKAYREFLGSYLEQRNNALADLRSGMDYAEAYERYLDGRKDTKPQKDRFRMWQRALQNGAEMITEADLASEKSMQDAAARSPELAAQINDARKYAQGASWAKKRIGYTAYNNHILKWTDDRIRKLNSQFGLRLYSFSDFSPAFILENMQMITDASVRGLKMLAYTKDINFAKIFAPSGININISTFAYEGADGTMVQDGMQGADWAEAQAMRDQFENVGITFVAVNDAQVDWAISQDWIDVVIPFHLVRTGAKVAESFGWKNYTQMSGDVKTKDWTKGDKKSIYPSEHQNDRERYFEALRKNHLEPRFRDWASDPNYMKLVNETRRSAGETSAVQPVFDVDAAKAAIEEMRKRGGYYRPIGNTDENMREIAGEIADKIRGEERWSISEEDQTKTKWFKRWFGDWKNDPANASKIVNADGTPKVMYHGSKNNFYEFSNDVAGGLFHFAPDESVSGSYAVSAGGARGQLENSAIRVVDADGNVYEYDGAESWVYIGRLRNDEKFWDVSDTNIEDADPLYDAPDVLGEREVERLVDAGEMTAIPKQTYVSAFYLNARNPLHMDNSAIPVLREIYNALEADGRHSNELSRTLYYLRNDMDMWSATKNEAFNREWQNMIVPELKKRGYDSISFRDKGHDTVAVFDPAQIKSATGNIGTFNSNDPDVRFSISEEEPADAYSALPTKAQTRVRDLERNFGIALDKMFGLGMTYKSDEFGQYVRGVVRPLTEAYLQTGSIPQEETDAVFAEHYNPLSGTDEALQKDEFYRAVEQLEEGLRNAKRFAEGGKTSADTEAPENPMPTAEEAEELFRVQRDARREMDKVMRKVLLTPEDEVTVGELLRGTRSEDQITENRQDILAAYHAQKAFRDADAAVGVYKKRLKAELYKHVDKYLGNVANWKDKIVPLMYQRETMERNIRDIIPDKAEADAFIAEFITPVHQAEAQRQRFIAEYRDRIRALGLSDKVAKGNAQSEAYAVQLLGEAQDNIRILSRSGKLVNKRDGHTLEEWRGLVDVFWEANPNMDRAKIQRGIEEFRAVYNELLPKINEVRIRNGYAPVAFRQGYFPHFTLTSEDTVLAKLLHPFGIQLGQDVLPTAINGLTADFKPGITYFKFGNERLGFETTYDALQGFEQYLNAASDVIYHTDNIQKLRALATRIRYLTGDDGVKERIDKVRNNDSLDEAEKQVQLAEIYRDGRYMMSNFVLTMDEYTNLLANKKSRLDRGVEELFGRPAYAVMKNLESRVAANMVAGNLGSALTNFIPLNQAGAVVGDLNMLKGMFQTVRGIAAKDGFAAMSDFLTNRRGSTSLVRTTSQKVSDIASKPMEWIDNFVSESIVRAAYAKNLADGMGEELALQHADALAASIMADRSKGSMPTLFHVRNPLMKLFTQFQLEVNNEYSVIFKDITELAKADAKTKSGAIARIAGLLFRYFVGAWLFNELYEKLFGRRAALDPVGMIVNTVGDIAEGEDPGKALQNLGTEAVENLPFVGGLLGGGRVPIQSALPDLSNLTMAATSDTWTTEKKALTAFEELSKPAAYLLPPVGGGQLRKSLLGIAAVAQGGVYGIEGDEDGGTYLKYPVYDDLQDQLNAIAFGTTYTEGGKEWVESGFKNLSVKQTDAYLQMTDSGADDRAAYDLIQEYKSVPDGEGKTAAQREVIRTADIPGEAKFAAYYNLGASENRQMLMVRILTADPYANPGEVAEVLMSISDLKSGKTASTCDILAQSELSDEAKLQIYRAEVSDSRDDDISAADRAGITFDEYLDAHSAYSELYNNDALSKTEQATEFARYIDRMDLTDPQRELLRDEIFKFYSQVPVSAKSYTKLRDIGISDDYAVKLTQALGDLEPLPGEKSVSTIQKARAVMDTLGDDEERLAALGTVLSESQYKKVSIAAQNGLDPEVWVDFREILPDFDADGNGSYTQTEVEDAIRALSDGTNYGTLLGKTARNLSKDEMAILWQMSGKWNADNNPFSRITGRKVKKLFEE